MRATGRALGRDEESAPGVKPQELSGAAGCAFSADGRLVQSSALLTIPWLRHASTTRLFENGRPEHGASLSRLRDALELGPGPVVFARQKHTANVGVVRFAEPDSAPGETIYEETDALVCDLPNVLTAVFTADCVPIFLVEESRRIVGLVHAGWRGTLQGIAGRAVERIRESGGDPSRLIAWIGPAISGRCYEVSGELAGEFASRFAPRGLEGPNPFVQGRLVDLPAINAHQLLEAGVPATAIHSSGLCTLTERDRFYSYRGDGAGTGRIISAMAVVSG